MSTAPLRLNGVKYGISDTAIYVTAYGAKGDGVTDDTAAIQAAFAAAVAGQVIYFPSGNYVVSDNCVITKDNVHVWGSGVRSCRITFGPASAKACFKVDNGGGVDRTYGGTIRGFYFAAGNQTQQKIAIDLVDTSGYSVRDVWVDPSNSASTPWHDPANSSVGIRLRGREATVIDNVRLWGDAPILIDVDPYISSPVSCDHLHVSDTYLLSRRGVGSSCMKINDNIIVTNLTIDGDNAWVVDKYGLYWVDVTSTTVSQNIDISGVRCEQANDATGYSFNIDHTQGIYNMRLRNCQPGIAQNAVWAKGITNFSIEHGSFQATSGALSHLTVDRMKDLKVSNTFWQIGPTATLTGLTQIVGSPPTQAAQAMPSDGFWVDTASTATRSQRITAILTAIGNVFNNPSAANTNPPTWDTTNAFSGGNSLMEWKNAGTRKAYIDNNGSFESANGVFDCIASVASLGGFTATGTTVGKAGTKMTAFGGFAYGTPQAIAAASSITINPLTASLVRISLSATAISSLTLTAGSDGAELVIEVIQDSTGGRTIPTTWTNVQFAGGTYTATATANKRDVITFVYNLAATKWIEIGRAMNI